MAQKLKFGNGTWATKEGSTLAYNDENNNYKPLPFSFERDSIATRVNKEGLIEVVGNDKPRIDFADSEDGALLLEPSRTNLWTESEGTSITLNSPLGEFGFYTLKNSQIDRSISASNPIAFTFIVKKIDGTIPTITNSSGNGDLVVYVGGSSSAGLSGNLTDIGDGFYKFELKIANTGSGVEVIRNNSGVDTYVSLIQIEVGSYATSYIPTNGSSVTRQTDTANGAGNSEVFNDSEGVLFFNLNTFDTSSVPVFSLSDGTFSNEIEFAYYGTNQWNVILRVGGANTSVIGTVNGDAYSKFSVSYTSSNFKVFLNGFLIGSNTMASAFSGLKKINFSYPDEANPFYGKTKELGYYDTALTDEELEYLTSYRSLNELVTELNLNTL